MKPPNKTPCSACPFRKKSMAGYLGAHTVDEFLLRWNSDNVMECHMTVPEDIDYVAAVRDGHPSIRACAGASIMKANSCTLPRDRNYPMLPRSSAVFRNKQEFLVHHDTEFHRKFVASLEKDRLR